MDLPVRPQLNAGMTNTIELSTIREAAARIAPWAHRTPVLTSQYFDRLCDGQVFFKCENFQKVGAFKFRGAMNAVAQLNDADAARGVVTHSSGNHAQALALTARLRGIPAFIVMPRNAPTVKRNAVADYGAEIIPCEPNVADRERTCDEVQQRTGATLIHPYNDLRIIAGQATAALELLEEVPDLDLVVAPVGGGGLLSGTALTVSFLRKQAQVYGAEPRGADDAWQSLAAGQIVPSVNPQTIADGLRTSLGDLTFPLIQQHVAQIVCVSEEAIASAMRDVWERMKIVIEPSAAVPLAALLGDELKLEGRRAGVIFSGGNVDLANLPW